MFFIDPFFIIFVLLPTLALSGGASLYLRRTYSKWSQEPNSSRVTGNDTARQLMRQFNLDAQLGETPQPLGDHFSPNENIVRLSPNVARQPSVASMAISAHEFGHVQQYAEKSPLIAARTFLIPAVQFGSGAAYIFILLGVIMQFTGLAVVGLVLFGAGVLFSLLTLPVEFDASRRALKMLDTSGLLATREDRNGAQAVLRAAALTYVAALVSTLLTFAYYAMLVAGINRD